MKEQKKNLQWQFNSYYFLQLLIILFTIMSRVIVVVSNANAAAVIRPSTSQYATTAEARRRTLSFVVNTLSNNNLFCWHGLQNMPMKSSPIAFVPITKTKTRTKTTTNIYYNKNDWTLSSSSRRISSCLYSTTSSSISSSINNTQTSSSSSSTRNNNDNQQQNDDFDSKDEIIQVENDNISSNNVDKEIVQIKKIKKERKITPLKTDTIPPWNSPNVINRIESRSEINTKRARQHVNPLAYQFQLPTILHESWPNNSYTVPSKPLHLDIGCGRGGFLLDLIQYELLYIQQQQQQNTQNNDSTNSTNSLQLLSELPYNYLGLEIRPIVVANAIERIKIHNVTGVLDFIGCNVNVDLQRILHLYHQNTNTNTNTNTNNRIQQEQDQQQLQQQDLVNTKIDNQRLLLEMVTIQFPDPLFKLKHAKRRVVTNELIYTLASYMPPNSTVFLQSDIKSVLDSMRQQFRQNDIYFQDSIDDCTVYQTNNIFTIPTEREISVLERNLPIYRALFTRTNTAVTGRSIIEKENTDDNPLILE